MTTSSNNPFGTTSTPWNMFTDMAKADLVAKSAGLAGKIIDKYADDLENIQLSQEKLEKVAMLTLLGTVNNITL